MSDAVQRQIWRRIADEMGIELIIPEHMKVNGRLFAPTVVVKGYGAPEGMVVFAQNIHSLEDYELLTESGYGFSVLELDADVTARHLDDLLNDWGSQ